MAMGDGGGKALLSVFGLGARRWEVSPALGPWASSCGTSAIVLCCLDLQESGLSSASPTGSRAKNLHFRWRLLSACFIIK